MDLLVANTTDVDTAATDAVAGYKNDGATTPSFGAAHVVDASFAFEWGWVTHATYATDVDADGDRQRIRMASPRPKMTTRGAFTC